MAPPPPPPPPPPLVAKPQVLLLEPLAFPQIESECSRTFLLLKPYLSLLPLPPFLSSHAAAVTALLSSAGTSVTSTSSPHFVSSLPPASASTSPSAAAVVSPSLILVAFSPMTSPMLLLDWCLMFFGESPPRIGVFVVVIGVSLGSFLSVLGGCGFGSVREGAGCAGRASGVGECSVVTSQGRLDSRVHSEENLYFQRSWMND